MLLLRNSSKSRIFLLVNSSNKIINTHRPCSADPITAICLYSTIQPSSEIYNLNAKDIALCFKQWFKSHDTLLFDRIFNILKTHNDVDPDARNAADTALSNLNLRLSESFVLDVLKYGHRNGFDVLSCLKFFDWAGRQPGFQHTRSTFYAVFKILSKARLMSVMLDFLENFMNPWWCVHRIRFYNTLVVGYAVAGKPYVALHMFGKMRFQGLDLDEFSYHVFLNALVEQGCFDAVEAIFKQISLRGFVRDITHSIMFKSMCKREKFDEAETYLEGLVSQGKAVDGHGRALGSLVDAFCKKGMFEQAGKLMEKFRDLGVVPLEYAYGVWLDNLARAEKLDGALEFLKNKKMMEGFVPDVFKYNLLVSRLLRENRLVEVFDLLTEMREDQILPDKITMNNALCFFCKAGLVDVARELYNSRSDFGLSPNGMAYNYLVNTLCSDGSTEEAFRVLKNSFQHGFFPGNKTFSLLADALCRERRIDKMKELVVIALQQNFMPSVSTYDKFIKALCGVNMLEDGYMIHEELMRMNKVTSKSAYHYLIHGFSKSNKREIAARLLIHMQQMGHRPTRTLFREVICCLCNMKDSEKQFMQLLEMQLSLLETDCQIYNFFIYGAGHAKRPDLARQVYDIMQRNGIESNLSTNIYMLQSYLKSERISNALNFFDKFRERRKIPRKLYHTMIVGLCKANKVDFALEFIREMRNSGSFPSNQCYEEIINLLCTTKRFDMVITFINELEKGGIQFTSFIGNVLLFHSLKNQDLYDAWIRLRDTSNETSKYSLLGQLIGVFSGCVKMDQDIDNLDEVIEQCFPLDIYTYNILLMLLSKGGMDHAYKLYNRMCRKGYKPNKWTLHALIQGLLQCGRTAESQRLLEKLLWKRDILVQMDARRKNEIWDLSGEDYFYQISQKGITLTRILEFSNTTGNLDWENMETNKNTEFFNTAGLLANLIGNIAEPISALQDMDGWFDLCRRHHHVSLPLSSLIVACTNSSSGAWANSTTVTDLYLKCHIGFDIGTNTSGVIRWRFAPRSSKLRTTLQSGSYNLY
ncbi:hypothetical protein Q3G72_015478 [Acer saccharum]|nr:hypothetical protein Q3G72_015478 [Acer saccharum]